MAQTQLVNTNIGSRCRATTTATVTDEAGNVSDASDIESFTLDDGVVELDAPVIDVAKRLETVLFDVTEVADGVQVQVTVPTGTVAGDLITLTVTQPNGNSFDVTETVPSDWNGTDAIDELFPLFDGEYSAVATVTDANGNVSTASNSDTFTVDRTEVVTPEAPTLAISEASPDGFGQIEASDGVQVQVSVPEDTVAGDVITLTVTQPDGTEIEITRQCPPIGMELMRLK